ncbi:hypothetical protein [Paraflavitalea pollutisoli]|uniref:hypothetical protein n=1 Tax=Paraflavitalea pollutisoli TaxID=3034143 RepID=UPI0023EB74DB|nr:hypothetical protein [Paraflavitalea sp. H1-2-19X]
MRPAVLLSAIVFVTTITLLTACTKDPEVQTTGTPTFTDSIALVQADWKVVKDSSTNIGNYFFIENGLTLYPTPGVYMGKSEDYWKFNSTGAVVVHANQNTYSSTYELFTNNRLVVKDMLVHDTARIVTLTANAFTFQWSKVGANGGQYFRRVYLSK